MLWWRQGGRARAGLLVTIAVLGGLLNGLHALHGAISPPLAELGERILAEGPHDIVTIEGRLRGDANPTDYGVSLVIDVERVEWRGESVATSGGVRVSVGGTIGLERMDAWRAGRTVRAPVVLRRPQGYRNPGVPDQARALALRGISWLGSVKSGVLVDVVRHGTPISEWAAAARAYARTAVSAGMVPPTTREGDPGPAKDVGQASVDGEAGAGDERLHAAIVTAVLVGDRAGIPAEVTDRLQRAGTFHVIAISGGNIAILTALVFGVTRLARVPPRAGALITAVGIAGYGLVASGSASVTRATVVAILYLAARVLDLRAGGFAVLWSAMCGLLVWSPLALFDPGFLLTCGATIGILLSGGSPADSPETPHGARPAARRTRAWAWATIRATIAAEIVLLPVAATLFSRTTLAGLVLNLCAIPLMTIAQVSGLVMVVASGVAPSSVGLAGQVAAAAVHGLLASSSLVDRWTWLSWRMPPPPWIAVVAYYVAWAGVAVTVAAHRRVGAGLALIPALTCTVWVAWAPTFLPARGIPPPPGPGPAEPEASTTGLWRGRPSVLELVFLDVGQGDSALVRFPTGEAWVIDTGGLPGAPGFDVGARIVAPALWSLGVRHLEVLAITHGHPDHAGGAASLIEDFSAREVWEGVPVVSEPALVRAGAAAARKGSRWRQRYAGARDVLDGVTVRVLHPQRPDWQRDRVRNDDSLVFELSYGGFRALFTGDISQAVEDDLMLRSPANSRARPTVTVLKVPHHGSGGASSARLLRWLQPSLAVVSVGAGNRFGHPAPATLERYATLGIPVLRTDQAGAVAVVTDGERVTVSRWGPRGWVEVPLPGVTPQRGAP